MTQATDKVTRKKCSDCGEEADIPEGYTECYDCWSANTDRAFGKQ